MLNDIVEIFNSFRSKVDDVELNRSKNILKRNILLNMANQGDRLEEAVKSFNTFGTINHTNYVDMIEKVTSADINKAVELLLKGKPTLVVTGNAVNLVPSIADIQGRLGNSTKH